jgi:glucokinase
LHPEPSTYPRLLGDIGGTNARFAWQSDPGSTPTDIDTLAASAYAGLLEAIRDYLRRHGKPVPASCAIGIANPVLGDHVQMTNHHWSFSVSGLQRELGLQRLRVINDFTALALALPVLKSSDLRQVGGGHAIPGEPIGLVGPGTGLGVSGLVPGNREHRVIPLDGEGGHATLAATNEREDQVVAVLRRRFGHASAERAVSGQGLENLFRALCELDGEEGAAPLDAPEITARALAGDARCAEVLGLFFSFLGTVAGNLALSLGARGGVYIGGGIVPKLGSAIDRSRFRRSFEQKGRMTSYLVAIPTYVIQAEVSPALVGASRALDTL